MDFEIDRYADGYLLTIFPPLTAQEEQYRGLTSEETRARLLDLGQHAVDIIEIIRGADQNYTRGTTELARVIRQAWRRARAGVATEEDL